MSHSSENENLSAVHERARKLIDQHHVEGLDGKDRGWLGAHLQECSACAGVAESTEKALRVMRSVPIPFPSGLASRTQFRVHLRAQQLEAREPRNIAVWAIAGISWAVGIATAPYVWQLFAWAGERLHVPRLAWELGFGLWWLIPALVAVGILLAANPTEKLNNSFLRR
jgi:hypothetical protein